MPHRFYRDAAGAFRAQVDSERALLGRFLEADVQGSPATCDLLLAALDEVASGRRTRWQQTGNAHTLIVGRRRARIRAEFGSAPDLILPFAELAQALREWRTLLDGESSS